MNLLSELLALTEFATAQDTGVTVYVKLKSGEILGPYKSRAAAYTAAKGNSVWIKDEKQLTDLEKKELQK